LKLAHERIAPTSIPRFGGLLWFAGVVIIALFDYLIPCAFCQKNQRWPRVPCGCSGLPAAACEFSNSQHKSPGQFRPAACS